MIIDLQRRLHETGRIRIGTSVPAKSQSGKDFRRPVKLETFLFTSSNVRALQMIAELFGGKVEPWAEAPGAPQSKVLTEASEIPVLVPPEHMAFSQAFEHWDAGRCMRRCDGRALLGTGEECVRDADNRECKPTTRLSLMLPQLAGSGLWRLDTRGYYAATELAGAFGLAQILAEASGRSIIPGVLRLTQREVKREDPRNHSKTITHKFAVPVIDFDLGPALPSLVAGASPGMAAIAATSSPPGLSAVPALPVTTTLADELAHVEEEPRRSTRANAAEPIRATGLNPRGRGAPADEGEPDEAPASPPRTQAAAKAPTPLAAAAPTGRQTKAIRTLLSKIAGVEQTDEAKHAYVADFVGRPIDSMNDLSFDEASRVIAELQVIVDSEAQSAMAGQSGDPF